MTSHKKSSLYKDYFYLNPDGNIELVIDNQRDPNRTLMKKEAATQYTAKKLGIKKAAAYAIIRASLKTNL